MRELVASNAAAFEGLQQKHRAVVRHAQALTQEMTQLAQTVQGLDSLRKDQQQQIGQLSSAVDEGKAAHASRAEELSEQIEKLRHSAAIANGCGVPC